MKFITFSLFILMLLITSCKDDKPQSKPSGQVLLAEALLLEDSSRYEEAVSKLTAALDLNPNDIQCLYYRAWDFYRLGQKDNAQADFERMIQLDSLNTAGLYGKALLLYEVGEYEPALDYFYTIIQIQGGLDMEKNKLRKQPIIDAPLQNVFELKDSIEMYLGIEPIPDEVLIPYSEENVLIETQD